MSDKKKKSTTYRVIRWLVSVFYPKIEVEGLENLPSEPSIIVGNHSQMHGPIASELYFPGKRRIWCAGEMMHADEVQPYAYRDFWSYKPKYIRWFYKLLSYAIVPLSVCIFNHANTIGVYRDIRIISTFKTTIRALQDGTNIIIFPEHAQEHNHILCDFQTKFIDLGKLYYKKTGKNLPFVPIYIAPKLKKMFLGKPIYYNHELPADEECVRISQYLMDEITRIACDLPEHIVIPYLNISPKLYHTNKQKEDSVS